MNQITYINGVSVDRNKIIVNGQEYTIPEKVGSSNIAIIDGRIFINGYEFKNGKWIRSLRALWHKYF